MRGWHGGDYRRIEGTVGMAIHVLFIIGAGKMAEMII